MFDWLNIGPFVFDWLSVGHLHIDCVFGLLNIGHLHTGYLCVWLLEY